MTREELYGQALEGGIVYLRGEDGARRRLPVERWLGALGAADERTLDRARGPVLDVGCGPGRHLLGLASRGVQALGVDLAPAAVKRARGRGAAAVLGSVFEPLPGRTRWRTALLLDGNIGIGGQPTTLLDRLRGLLRPGGAVLCELDPPGVPTRAALVALEAASGLRSGWFAWAWVSVDAIGALAGRSGMTVRDTWCDDGRWFAALAPGGGAAWRRGS